VKAFGHSQDEHQTLQADKYDLMDDYLPGPLTEDTLNALGNDQIPEVTVSLSIYDKR
jgi:hypothetical protein